jgi:hypothetical protein
MDSDLIDQRMKELAVKIATEQDREQVLVLSKELNQLLEQQQRQKAPKPSRCNLHRQSFTNRGSVLLLGLLCYLGL